MSRWVVKIARVGSVSVLNVSDTKADAERVAEVLNTGYQTDEYYVEAWKTGSN